MNGVELGVAIEGPASMSSQTEDIHSFYPSTDVLELPKLDQVESARNQIKNTENQVEIPRKTVSFSHRKTKIRSKIYRMKTISADELINEYRSESLKHGVKPFNDIEVQLASLETSTLVLPCLALNTIKLDRQTAESLEIIFIKLIGIENVCLRGAQMNDDACQVLFEIFTYYDSIIHLEAGSNTKLGLLGWTAISKYVGNSKKLEILDLDRTIFTEQFVTLISRAIYSSASLKVVILNNCHLNNVLLKAFNSVMGKNNHIEEIYLSENKISSYDCQHVGEIVRNCRSLKILDLENNPIQDSGFLIIMDFLCTFKMFNLESFYLWNTGITSSSMYKLGEYLEGGSDGSKISLKTLNIGKNRIQDEGILLLKPALIKNSSLKKLGMASVKFSPAGIVALAEIVAENRSLLLLDLRGNTINTSGMLALSHSLKQNRIMAKIYLNTNFKVDKNTELELNKLLDEIRTKCRQNSKNSDLEDDHDLDVYSMISSSSCELNAVLTEEKPASSSIFSIFYTPWQYAKSKIFSMFFTQDIELNLEIHPEKTTAEHDLSNSRSSLDSPFVDETELEVVVPPIAESKNKISDSCSEIPVGSRFTVRPVDAGHRRCHSEATVLTPVVKESIRSQECSIKMSKPVIKLPAINIIPSDEKTRSPSSKKSSQTLPNTFPPYRKKLRSLSLRSAFKDLK